MTAPVLRSTWVNRGHEAFPAAMADEEHAALTELLALYNPVGGPITKVFTELAGPGPLHSNVSTASFSSIDRLLRRLTGVPSLDPGTQDSISAGGKGFTLFDMFASSAGETVERVIGSLRGTGGAEQRSGTYDELRRAGVPCMHPDRIPLFSAAQYARPDFVYEPFTTGTPLSWTRGSHLVSGEEVWVPSQLVELVHLAEPGEASIGYGSSGGLSSHVTREAAIYHGVREIVERDALNLRWYLRVPPERVTVTTAPRGHRLRTLLAELAVQNEPVDLLYHSLDITEIPVFTAVRVEPWRHRFGFCAGAGADLDAETALSEAIGEFGQSERILRSSFLAPDRPVSQLFARQFDLAPDAPLSEMLTYVQSLGYYGNRELRGLLTAHRGAGDEIALADISGAPPRREGGPADAARLAALCAVLDRHGIDPVVFDRTPEGLSHLRLMRVFVPELTQPFLQSRPMLGHPRFARVRDWLGERSPLTGEPQAAPPLPYP
ncbi:hypothetical protein G3I19_09745 [Streptomyces sp. SID10853]|uniref:YcaO-like family protein n=1 Tax=Streptomyces sp. SID10853 TaxID=2706028 RepID=UPI0013C0D456|nr:YcaO-like family protein [Streptomyces sp. SID10853]NDZ78803.1 hypothetical protein [Streptomyces sp. SID10853]